MSDDSTSRILAAIERLEQGQDRMRVDLMARMDRLQHRMDQLDEHLTMGLGHADAAEKRAQSVTEDNRILREQLMSLTKLLRMLEARVNDLEARQS
jgi:chromosome segregation ATPase